MILLEGIVDHNLKEAIQILLARNGMEIDKQAFPILAFKLIFKCFKIISSISIEMNELLVGMCKLQIKRQEKSELDNVSFWLNICFMALEEEE